MSVLFLAELSKKKLAASVPEEAGDARGEHATHEPEEEDGGGRHGKGALLVLERGELGAHGALELSGEGGHIFFCARRRKKNAGMAVSISEAWNEMPARAARRAVARAEDEDEAAEGAAPVASTTLAPMSLAPMAAQHEALLAELQLLRQEETRRCTIYLTVGGVLFAILFMYIDRLQSQIRTMHTMLLHQSAYSAPLARNEWPRQPFA